MPPWIPYAVAGAVFATALAWIFVGWRRDAREEAEAAAECQAFNARLAADREASFQRQAAEVLALADYFCRYSAHQQGLSLLDELTDQHPMPKRPAPPMPAPGEPWQLSTLTDLPGLVGPADSDD